MAWAVEQQLPATKKIVLLMLANRVNSDTGKCVPKIKTLASDCGLSESATKAALKELTDAGLIKVHQRFYEGQQLPNQYELSPDGVGLQKTPPRQQETPVGHQVARVGRQKATESGKEPVIEPVIETKKSKQASPPPAPPDVDEQIWKDWLQLRKTKDAPVTATVVRMARKEAEKSSMCLQGFLEIWCMRGSQGLKAEWLKDSERGRHATANHQPKSFAQTDRESALLRWEEMTGEPHPEMNEIRAQRGQVMMGHVVDVTPKQFRLGE